jgi:hypothetical protein
MTPIVISEPAAPTDKGLRAGALGLASSVVIAVSSTAPAYSMAATSAVRPDAPALPHPHHGASELTRHWRSSPRGGVFATLGVDAELVERLLDL